VGGVGLLSLVATCFFFCAFGASPELAPIGGLGYLESSRALAIFVLEARACWPNLRHFLHWFGRPEYKILCLIVLELGAPSAMEGIMMNPASLVMSWTSIVTMGPAGLLM
jgi:hypothetical protein